MRGSIRNLYRATHISVVVRSPMTLQPPLEVLSLQTWLKIMCESIQSFYRKTHNFQLMFFSSEPEVFKEDLRKTEKITTKSNTVKRFQLSPFGKNIRKEINAETVQQSTKSARQELLLKLPDLEAVL